MAGGQDNKQGAEYFLGSLIFIVILVILFSRHESFQLPRVLIRMISSSCNPLRDMTDIIFIDTALSAGIPDLLQEFFNPGFLLFRSLVLFQVF